MEVSICIVGLGIVITTSWYSFMWRLAVRSEQKHRLREQLLSEQGKTAEAVADISDNSTDLFVA